MLLRFVGKDRSMSLHHGMLYRVAVQPLPNNQLLMTRPVYCPYESDTAFWKNWELPEKAAQRLPEPAILRKIRKEAWEEGHEAQYLEKHTNPYE